MRYYIVICVIKNTCAFLLNLQIKMHATFFDKILIDKILQKYLKHYKQL